MTACQQSLIVDLSIGRKYFQWVFDLSTVTYLGADILPITRRSGSVRWWPGGVCTKPRRWWRQLPERCKRHNHASGSSIFWLGHECRGAGQVSEGLGAISAS